MSEGRNTWLVKLEDGQIVGPYTTQEVLEMISRGELGGEEFISPYPKTQWVAIASDPTFYDHLLNILAGEAPKSGGRQVEDFEVTQVTGDEANEPLRSETQTKTAQQENRYQQTPEIEEEDGWSFSKKQREDRSEETETKTYHEPPEDTVTKSHTESVIELVDIKSEARKQKRKKGAIPILFGLVAVVALALIFIDVGGGGKRIHFLEAKNKGDQLTQKKEIQFIKRGVRYYLRDSLSTYLKAQNDFVAVIESPKGNAKPEAMAMLCLTYFEIWPYAYQDSKDLNTLGRLTSRVSKASPGSLDASTCKVVRYYLLGKYKEAKGLIEAVLSDTDSKRKSPTIFYYFKALLLKDQSDFETALGYLRSAQQLWPQWLKPYLLEADIYLEMNNPGDASRRYRDVLKANPKHKEAQIKLGLISFRFFRHYQEAKKYLRAALALKEAAPQRVISDANLGLAEIALYEKNNKEALKYAKACYYANTSNKSCKNLISSLGGKADEGVMKGKGAQLVIEGDQFFREGDYHSAQAIYKTAYELNSKNGMAAMKAGQSLWKMSLSSEAIKWMNKAIKADPMLIRAYTLLSDYYSTRFDFTSAARVLQKASRMSKNNYDVVRGYALLELRRQNPKGAITYCKKALALNSGDSESYILLARAYMAAQDFKSAHGSAARAIELEATSVEGQITYAKALSGVQGVDVAINYISRIIERYPDNTEYRQALGEIYLDDERFMDAERELRNVIRIRPKPKKAYLMLADALAKQENYDVAQQALLRAAAIDPSDPEALFRAGQLFIEVKNPEQARAQLQRVLRVNPKYPRVHYFLGRAALMMGDSKGALEESKLEKRINPNLADAYVLAAEAYSAMRQFSFCAGEYQKALKLRPGNAHLYVKLAKCYRLMGNHEVALKMLKYADKLEQVSEIYKEMGSIYEKQGKTEEAITSYRKYFVLEPQAIDRKQIEQRMGM